MQPDYMKMAQAQKAPQEQANPKSDGSGQQLKQELQQMSKEDLQKYYKENGMPTEATPEAAKKRLMSILEELGILENLRPDQLEKINSLVDEYIQIAQSGDMEALERHPISNLLNQAASEVKQAAGMGKEAPTQPQQPPQQPQQPAAPTNFAGMVKPPGGGMSGR
jgi:acyl-CoA synthetase (NDP forming)